MKFVGNVVARQGDVTIYAQELTLILAEVDREVERIEAVGDVRIVQGERIATGQQGVFYRGEGRIVLSGSPRVHQGEDFIEGDEITVFLNSEKSIVKSREGTRVNAIFHPRGESRP
jgi:lipopolysaccharide export system protein LptA